MGEWDTSLKTLVASCPLAFAELVLSKLGIETHGMQLLAQLDTRFQNDEVEADALLLVKLADGEVILVHIEFQSTPDTEMPDRQLEYCVRARKKHGNKPIISCVIYLRDMGKVHEPPHCWELRNGRKLMAFDYLCLKLYEENAEKILALRQPAILPLTLLTKGGASCTIVAGIFDELVHNGLRNLLPVTNVLAGLAFMGDPDNLAWLERKYREMMSILQDSPAYHWMTDEALNKGRTEGREEGREEGRVETLQQVLASLIAGRFPQLGKLAQKQLALIKHSPPLKKLFEKIVQAQTPDEMKRALFDALEESLLLD